MGRLARRAAFAWPSLTRLVSPDVEQRSKDEIVRRRTALTGDEFTTRELRSLARRYRTATEIDEPLMFLGGPRE
jgi:hypothetical protein